MPLPKAFLRVLDTSTPEIIAAGTHATAQLVLHLVGHQRLQRDQIKRYAEVLRELLELLREEEDTRAT